MDHIVMAKLLEGEGEGEGKGEEEDGNCSQIRCFGITSERKEEE